MATYGFDESAAKRIGKAVRLSERYPHKVKLSGPDRSGANAGVRIMLGKVTTTNAWTKGTSKTVTIYGGEPHTATGLPPTTAGTALCWNIMVSVDAHTAERWVQMSNNGFAWYALGVECL